MPTGDHRDTHVPDRLVRVFADERGRVHACPNCPANAGTADVVCRRANVL